MVDTLTGETRLFGVIGDPIAQVKAPASLSRVFAQRGLNAIFVPFHVPASGLENFFLGASEVLNLDGMTVTIPHKIAASKYIAELTERARFLGAVNVVRRLPHRGGWTGDMVDGLGFMGALARNNFEVRGKKALLIGAGGVGSAISFSLLDAGVAELAIHDVVPDRRDRLIEKLRRRSIAAVTAGSNNPQGFDLVINGSPAGMAASDPIPINVTELEATAFAADVIPTPLVTPFIAEARRRGCRIQTGGDMFNAQIEPIVSFLLGENSNMVGATTRTGV